MHAHPHVRTVHFRYGCARQSTLTPIDIGRRPPAVSDARATYRVRMLQGRWLSSHRPAASARGRQCVSVQRVPRGGSSDRAVWRGDPTQPRRSDSRRPCPAFAVASALLSFLLRFLLGRAAPATDGVRFELTIPGSPVCRFSRPVPSTTRPPVQGPQDGNLHCRPRCYSILGPLSVRNLVTGRLRRLGRYHSHGVRVVDSAS